MKMCLIQLETETGILKQKRKYNYKKIEKKRGMEMNWAKVNFMISDNKKKYKEKRK